MKLISHYSQHSPTIPLLCQTQKTWNRLFLTSFGQTRSQSTMKTINDHCVSGHQPPHFQKLLAGVQSEMIMNSRRSLTLDRHTPTQKFFPPCFLRSACREKQNTEREDDSFSVRWFNYTNCGIALKFRLSNDVAKPRHVCKYWNEQCSEKWKSKVQQSALLVSNCSQTLHSWSTACVCDTWGVSMIFSDSITTDAFPRRLPPSLACCLLPALTNGGCWSIYKQVCWYLFIHSWQFLWLSNTKIFMLTLLPYFKY